MSPCFPFRLLSPLFHSSLYDQLSLSFSTFNAVSLVPLLHLSRCPCFLFFLLFVPLYTPLTLTISIQAFSRDARLEARTRCREHRSRTSSPAVLAEHVYRLPFLSSVFLLSVLLFVFPSFPFLRLPCFLRLNMLPFFFQCFCPFGRSTIGSQPQQQSKRSRNSGCWHRVHFGCTTAFPVGSDRSSEPGMEVAPHSLALFVLQPPRGQSSTDAAALDSGRTKWVDRACAGSIHRTSSKKQPQAEARLHGLPALPRAGDEEGEKRTSWETGTTSGGCSFESTS